MEKLKALVLFSGGLDSRVTAKFMEELGYEIHLGFVKLPFGSGCGSPSEVNKQFAKENNFYFHEIDSTKGDLLEEYISFVKNPKHGFGTAINPCKDCKIFIFKECKKLAEAIKADVICTGEVVGQRPMSQKRHSLLLDEEQAGLKDKLLRPLSAKLLPETIYEKKGLVNREKMLSVEGRRREVQMQMTDKYDITYPEPAGGCVLCEKLYAQKLRQFLKKIKNPTYDEISILKYGRLFQNKGLILVGRDAKQNEKLQELSKKINWNFYFDEEIPGPTVSYQNDEDKELVLKLWKAYSSKNLKERESLDKYKI